MRLMFRESLINSGISVINKIVLLTAVPVTGTAVLGVQIDIWILQIC